MLKAGKARREALAEDNSGEPLFSGPSWGAVAALAAGAAFSAMAATASAGTIVQDNFTSGSNYGNSMSTANGNPGLSPSPTNLPGGTWQHIADGHIRDGEWLANKNSLNHAGAGIGTSSSNQGSGVGLPLGAYNTGTLQVSANIFYNQAFNGTPVVPTTLGNGSYTLLGFNVSTNSSSDYGPKPTVGFTGLQVTTNGSLQQIVNGTVVGSPIGYGGTYTPFTSTPLSYQIDTSTGAISNVTFGNSTANYAFGTGTFANADTAFLEIGGLPLPSTGTSSYASTDANEVWFNGLTITSVPEPSGLMVMLGGMSGGLLRRRSRKRQADDKIAT
ncbi:MAG TPA: PEP-CTERM sorting domain-containing protein [Tepidisphaeraceae bacterium]|jgi:hypothetical protein|nr:PEP-CTERM sorting domain-containing protein [Tepidisphaeraceae bacterium]